MVPARLYPDDGLVLTPPFDHTPHDLVCIKGYPPGLRENGGQYTHAATWAVPATAALGDGDRVADVYSMPPHVGRSGWSWYPGSAGWPQRAGVDGILRIRASALHSDPCTPRNWPGFEATIVWRSARYRVVVGNTGKVYRGVGSIRLDGVDVAVTPVPLLDDRSIQLVEVRLDGKDRP